MTFRLEIRADAASKREAIELVRLKLEEASTSKGEGRTHSHGDSAAGAWAVVCYNGPLTAEERKRPLDEAPFSLPRRIA